MIIPEENHIQHYGILRKSGRYPWGSGADPEQRAHSFFGIVAELKKQGFTPSEIADSFSTDDYPFNTTDLRATNAIARNAKKAADIAQAQMYKDKQYSNVAIGIKMGEPGKPKNESSIRDLLAPGAKDRNDQLTTTANMLRDQVAEKNIIQIGKGVARQLGTNDNHLQTAVAMLKSEGYVVHNVQVPNIGSPGNKTLIKVLAPEGTEYKTIVKDLSQIHTIQAYSDDNGRSFSHIQPPLTVPVKRIKVQYKEDTPSGAEADGVIYVRPGVKDLSMGASNYAQVRIQVGDGHYLKGMAMYKDDLPPGIDLQFNTNKSDKGDKLSAMKPLKRLMAEGDDPKKPDSFTGPVDKENPFGSIVRQIGDKDPTGRVTKVTSALNLVNEEGDWDRWSNTMSAQMLSKQKNSLIKERLDATFDDRKKVFDEYNALTNPAVKKKLLESYADDVDAAAVHLKAAGMARQRTQVILPMSSLKPTEIYAPNFDHGEQVVLIRYPHGGKFEIPELTVNNNHRAAKKLLGNAKDAVGINHKVAERLSGADFDGDTVVVIPNNKRKIQSESPLKELEGFDPQRQYKGYEGMPPLTSQRKQYLMGDVSNLITDMTIKGAANHEIAQAVKHSMVVIDAEKHNLNYRQSALDNNISSLKKKYQGDGKKANVGASTLISQKRSPKRVPETRLQKASEGGSIDPKTGKKIYKVTGAGYEKDGKWIPKTSTFKKLEYALDIQGNAHKLSSGTVPEKLYADHSNKMKDLANQIRLASVHAGTIPHSDSAARVYSVEVSELKSALNLALQNAPRERQAQVLANAKVAAIKASNPHMDRAEVKKLEYLSLSEARARVGAKKEPIIITDNQWQAIQNGAIRHTVLRSILDNADIDRVKKLATPHAAVLMTTAKQAKAQRLMASGASQAAVADQLGVSLSTLKKFLNGEG